MHRFFLPPSECQAGPLMLSGREAHHALHVLRIRRGERVTVLDGAGGELICDVEDFDRDKIQLCVAEKKLVPPLPCQITLLQAVPKGKIIESIIQKAVELSVARIVPILSERVVTQLDAKDAENKREKWQQVAVEAIKQCGATWLPKIETPQMIKEFLKHLPKNIAPFDLSLVGSLQQERRHPKEIFREFEKQNGRLPKSAAVWIGPEGDFTRDELQTIQNSGAVPITLGNLTLRVETAAIYCLSVLNYELQSTAS
jgi:16S rRNA (uracil1498-N3)-methyltransferase